MSWLVLAGRLASGYDAELGAVFFPTACHADDRGKFGCHIGFSDDEHGPIVHRPPSPSEVPYDSWCCERSFLVECDHAIRSVGRIEIKENYVCDYRYRADIDFTGIRAKIYLRPDVYQAYLDYIGHTKRPDFGDHTSWSGGVTFRIPSARFSFPLPYGSSEPWNNQHVVKKLKVIKKFNFNQIEVQILRDKLGRTVLFEEACTGQLDLEPALCLREKPMSSSHLLRGLWALGRSLQRK